MAPANYAVCEKCRKPVPSGHEVREGQVYLVKTCPDCGRTEALITAHADEWQKKRDLCRYDPEGSPTCNLHCMTCARQKEHKPRMVFVDVTNRCNMNCPICIANIPAMGFAFHPPISYFERLFDGISKMNPVPSVHFFGGEPTMREDLFDLIRLAQSKGLNVAIVTNGLKLADEEYCKKVCELGVRVLIALDGLAPEIYERLRKNASVLAKKLQALANLKKYSKRQQTIMCCVARKINDKHMRGLIDYCHENRELIRCLHLIPLTESWRAGEFQTDVHTSIEETEQIIHEAFPGEPVAFMPMNFAHHLNRALRFFGGVQMTFADVHPNCESVTVMLSDGTRYRPVGAYLKMPLAQFCEEIVKKVEAIGPKLDPLDEQKAWDRFRGRLSVLWNFAGFAWRSFRREMVFKGNPTLSLFRIFGGALLGKPLKGQIAKHCKLAGALDMIVLPFEEHDSIDGARLALCKGGFAFEDPDDGVVKSIPICVWSLFRDDVERKIAAKYGDAGAKAAPAPMA